MLQVDAGGKCILFRHASLPRAVAGEALFEPTFDLGVLLGKNLGEVLVAALAGISGLRHGSSAGESQQENRQKKETKFRHRHIRSGM
jgi:hydrogenase/urease accessory protein HupE